MHKSLTVRAVREVFRTMPGLACVHFAIKILLALFSCLSIKYMAVLFDYAGSIGNDIWKEDRFYFYAFLIVFLFGMPYLVAPLETFINERMAERNNAFFLRMYHVVFGMPLKNFDDPRFYNDFKLAQSSIGSKSVINYYKKNSDYIPKIMQFVGVLMVAISFSPAFVVISLFSIVPSVIANIIANIKLDSMRKTQVIEEKKRNYFWSILTSSGSVKELRAYNADRFIADKWTSSLIGFMEKKYLLDMRLAVLYAFCDIGKLIGLIVSIGISVSMTHSGMLSVGQFSACIAAFASLQSSSGALAKMATGQALESKKISEYYDFMDKYKAECGRSLLQDSSDRIVLDRVSYRYENAERNALDNIELTIRKGERVVLVGENGSGKTTLSKILAGVFSPTEGRILNGLSSEKVTVVTQDFVRYLFNLRENIGIGNLEKISDDQDIVDLLKRVGNDSVLQNAGSLDRQIGKEFDGVEFSGGEWQKIAIARGLFKDAELIIFDEPTSALDPIVESEILKKFLVLTEGKTVIVISHRIGICKMMDRVIVMRDGRVVEDGKHFDLIELHGEYQRLWHEQAKWYTQE